MRFKWSPVLETGIAMIDDQHKEMLETVNDFFIRRSAGQNIEVLESCLRFLENYILYHFQAEEAFQRQCNYPRYAAHCALHKNIATQVKFQSVKLRALEYSDAQVEEFSAFLKNWIEQHIYDEDMDFARFYRARKAEENA